MTIEIPPAIEQQLRRLPPALQERIRAEAARRGVTALNLFVLLMVLTCLPREQILEDPVEQDLLDDVLLHAHALTGERDEERTPWTGKSRDLLPGPHLLDRDEETEGRGAAAPPGATGEADAAWEALLLADPVRVPPIPLAALSRERLYADSEA